MIFKKNSNKERSFMYDGHYHKKNNYINFDYNDNYDNEY